MLEEDRVRFVDRVGDSGGGQYVVNLKHLFEVNRFGMKSCGMSQISYLSISGVRFCNDREHYSGKIWIQSSENIQGNQTKDSRRRVTVASNPMNECEIRQ